MEGQPERPLSLLGRVARRIGHSIIEIGYALSPEAMAERIWAQENEEVSALGEPNPELAFETQITALTWDLTDGGIRSNLRKWTRYEQRRRGREDT